MELTITLNQLTDDPATVVVCLAGSATIRNAGTVKERLLAALTSAERVLLHMEGITETDPSFLQLLCSARRTAEETGRELTLASGLPGPFIEAARAAGFLSTGCFVTGSGPPGEEEGTK